jgi:hypothetical protein
MSRNLRVMGLALVAATALTAVMASAAGAVTYTSNKPHTIASGAQTTSHVFKTSGGFAGLSCSTITAEGTSESEAAESILLVPTIAGCIDSLGRTVHVETSGLKFHSRGNVVDVTGKVTFRITNGSGTVVCTVVVEAQNGVNGISYKDLGGTNGVEITEASTNIKNTTSGGLLNCGVPNGLHENGTHEGKSIIKGVGTDGLAAAISVD